MEATVFDEPGYYAGIGSRTTPDDMLAYIQDLGEFMAQHGWTLRSGGARGADKAFELGCHRVGGAKEIFYPDDAQPWAYEEAKKHIPSDRAPFDTWKEYTRGLIARNMMQVLGRDGDQPVKVVICWTPTMSISQAGGTGYAVRCAMSRGIPIFELSNTARSMYLTKLLKNAT